MSVIEFGTHHHFLRASFIRVRPLESVVSELRGGLQMIQSGSETQAHRGLLRLISESNHQMSE